MFGALTDKMQSVFSSFTGKNKMTEQNISDAIRDVRLALLDADVNYKVASNFVKKVKEKALGDTVIKSVSPGQQFTKVVHDELISLMGDQEPTLKLKKDLSVFMLCGLQGSGKTTTCVKLAHYFQKQNKKTLILACDRQRPAAILQLKKLAEPTNAEVFTIESEDNPVKVASKGMEKAKKEGFDLVILDTAGRLHIDDQLMKELKKIKDISKPDEVLFVANAQTGQDAVNVAKQFDEKVEITGSILTMLDGSARAGAAISILEVTSKPLKFEGVGEKLGDLQLFNPKSMADRILGMGDVINLVKKAEECIDENESKKLEEKLKKASFTYEDYLKQMSMVKKMGSFKSLMKMMPGFSSMGDIDLSDDKMKYIEAMILSMTIDERQGKEDLSHMRKKRIANGSGVKLDEVNRLIKGFKQIKKMMKGMPNLSKGKGVPDLNELKKKFGRNKLWH